MTVSTADIVKVLIDIKENDIPFWELESNPYGNNLDSEESKEYAIQCIDEAIRLIKHENEQTLCDCWEPCQREEWASTGATFCSQCGKRLYLRQNAV